MEGALLIRVNGVLTKQSQEGACTSCSIAGNSDGRIFHVLVGAGPGVESSLKQASADIGSSPDAILITHGHKDQYAGIESILAAAQGKELKVYCTKECADQILKDLPALSGRISHVVPSQSFDLGPFSIVPVQAEHSGDFGSSPGAVIYVVRYAGSKIICGWDFLTLPNVDANLMWNPDLLIVGTESYNEHPSTGTISVSEAYNLVRRWNAKDTYILGYTGEKDSEDARNQWFRGPTRPMPLDELQKTVDEHLRVSGGEGKYSITVARQGMIWRPKAVAQVHDEPVSDSIEVEGIEKYVLRLLKKENGGLVFTVEDSINRHEMEFSSPRLADEGRRLVAEPIKGFMMKGPELDMSISTQGEESIVKVSIVKGKKAVLADNIRIAPRDAQRLLRYLNHNFASNKISASV